MQVTFLTLTLDIFVLVSAIAAFSVIRDYQRRRGLPYPPGPRPLPLIGNLPDISKEFSWLSYTQLSKKHGMICSTARGLLTEGMATLAGDILSFRVLDKVIVVLNSIRTSKDLLERRADIYSDRPVIPSFKMYVLSLSIHTWRLIQ